MDKKQRKRAQTRKLIEHHPPRLAHEQLLTDSLFRTAAEGIVSHLKPPAADQVRLIEKEQDIECPAYQAFLEAHYSRVRRLYGWDDETALEELEQMSTLLVAACNHELGGRKTFWVSPELVQILQQTNLDIDGSALMLPFASCAFVFNDAANLGQLEELTRPHVDFGRAPFKVLTVYVHPCSRPPRSVEIGPSSMTGS